MEPEIRHKPVRYYEIDLLRFVAAVSVVLFHFTYRGFHADHLSPVEYPLIGNVFKYGYLGVELFFIISGYVVLMSAKGKTLSQFFTSRVMRLYPAYWVACTFTFLIARLFGPRIHTLGWSPILDAPLRGYFVNMTMLQSFFGIAPIDGVYWTLTIELIFYFLIALLVSLQWFKHLVLILTLWLIYCAVIGPAVNSSPFAFLLFPRFAPFFIAGMVSYLLQTSQADKWKLYSLLVISYLLSLRAVRAGLEETQAIFHQPFSLVIVLVIVTIFFLTFIAIINNRISLGQSKWLAWAGALTYPIYLLHHNIGYIVLQHFGKAFDKYVLLFFMLITVFLLAYLLNRYVERRFSKMLGQKIQQLLARA